MLSLSIGMQNIINIFVTVVALLPRLITVRRQVHKLSMDGLQTVDGRTGRL